MCYGSSVHAYTYTHTYIQTIELIIRRMFLFRRSRRDHAERPQSAQRRSVDQIYYDMIQYNIMQYNIV